MASFKKGWDKTAIRRVLSPKSTISLMFALIVFGYLGFKAYRGAQQLAETGVHFAGSYLLLSLGCQSIGVLLAAAVWSDILRLLGVKSGYLFDLQAFCTSAVARKLPGTVWYAVSRLALYERIRWPRRPVVLALIIEAVVIALAGLVALGLCLGSGAMSLPGLGDTRYLLFLVLTFIAVGTWVQPIAIRFMAKRMMKNVAAGEIAQLAPVRFRDALRWLLGETSVIVLGACVAFFVIKSIDVNMPVPFVPVLGAWGLAVAVGPMAMWLPGDIGLKDGAMYLVLSPLISGPLAAVVTLAWRLWVTLLEILFGRSCGITLSRLIMHHEGE
jgi:hypothetical protein